jgi:hypothetical protein
VPRDDKDLSEAREAVRIVGTSAWGSDEYGNARALLARLLEGDLREWVRANPPGVADYDDTTPRRAVYIYFDGLHPDLSNNVVNDILFGSSYYEKVVLKILKSLKSASHKTEKDVVAARFPEYHDLCRKIRDVKKRWNTEDAAIKRSDSFRVVGGLARLGSRSGNEYSHLVEKAQTMEKAVLGKILTKYTRAGR